MQGGLEDSVGEIEIVTDERRRLVEVLSGLASSGGSWGIHDWFYLRRETRYRFSQRSEGCKGGERQVAFLFEQAA
jgi:hypothetical protein